MKLLTHNMLTSKCLKSVVTGYPLAIQATSVKVSEVEFNPEFVSRMIPKLDYTVLYNAAESVGHLGELPPQPVEDYESNEDFLKKVHHVLLEVEILNGDLICPETGRKFPINDGIPNMLLNEDESLNTVKKTKSNFKKRRKEQADGDEELEEKKAMLIEKLALDLLMLII